MPKPKPNPPNYWEVVVGNVGFVYEGTNGFQARVLYNQYVRISASHTNNCAYNESVTLFKNWDVHKYYHPLTLETGETDA